MHDWISFRNDMMQLCMCMYYVLCIGEGEEEDKEGTHPASFIRAFLYVCMYKCMCISMYVYVFIR